MLLWIIKRISGVVILTAMPFLFIQPISLMTNGIYVLNISLSSPDSPSISVLWTLWPLYKTYRLNLCTFHALITNISNGHGLSLLLNRKPICKLLWNVLCRSAANLFHGLLLRSVLSFASIVDLPIINLKTVINANNLTTIAEWYQIA